MSWNKQDCWQPSYLQTCCIAKLTVCNKIKKIKRTECANVILRLRNNFQCFCYWLNVRQQRLHAYSEYIKYLKFDIIKLFYSKQVNTKISVQNQKIYFPAVSFCNLNPISYLKIQEGSKSSLAAVEVYELYQDIIEDINQQLENSSEREEVFFILFLVP